MEQDEFQTHVVGRLGYISGRVDMLVERVEDVEDLEPRVAVLETRQRRSYTFFSLAFGAAGAFITALWKVMGA